MGLGDQRQPLRPRLPTNRHADPVSAIPCRGSSFTIEIGAAVDRVLDDPVDGCIARPAPGRVAARLLYRQSKIVLVQPAERLPCAAQLLNLVKDESDGFLHTPIRVLLIPVAGLHEADGG